MLAMFVTFETSQLPIAPLNFEAPLNAPAEVRGTCEIKRVCRTDLQVCRALEVAAPLPKRSGPRRCDVDDLELVSTVRELEGRDLSGDRDVVVAAGRVGVGWRILDVMVSLVPSPHETLKL